MTLSVAITGTLGVLTLIAQILIVLGLLFWLFQGFFTKSWKAVTGWMKKESALLGFILALVATLGSLSLSLILQWLPCELCWYQRVLMYPLVLIFGSALIRKAKDVTWYALPLAIIGAGFSLYQYIMQMLSMGGVCSTGVDCATIYSISFGYITIPLMAFTAFLAIILLLVVPKKQ